MKKGDVVTIRDNSYTKSVIGGKLVHEIYGCSIKGNERYTVIEINCVFPTERNQACKSLFKLASFNNTVIQAIDSDKVVFIEERFLELVLPTHKVMIDIKIHDGVIMVGGQVIEISDKLYKEIKKS